MPLEDAGAAQAPHADVQVDYRPHGPVCEALAGAGLSVTFADPLGVGSFGEVLRGRTEGDGMDVAIKLAHPGRESWVPLEASFLCRLDHPHIVGYRGLVSCDSPQGPRREGLVLEMCAGGSLEGWLADHGRLGPPALRERLLLAQQLLHALEHVHAAGFCHLDLKPGNVLLADCPPPGLAVPHLKLTDFGLGFENNGTFFPGRYRGTLPYMAPELARQLRSKARPALDVWSLGVILREMVLMAPACDGWRCEDVKTALRDRVLYTDSLGCEPEWEMLVQMCLDYDPITRATVPELQQAVAMFLAQAGQEEMLLGSCLVETAPSGRAQVHVAAGPAAGLPPGCGTGQVAAGAGAGNGAPAGGCVQAEAAVGRAAPDATVAVPVAPAAAPCPAPAEACCTAGVPQAGVPDGAAAEALNLPESLGLGGSPGGDGCDPVGAAADGEEGGEEAGAGEQHGDGRQSSECSSSSASASQTATASSATSSTASTASTAAAGRSSAPSTEPSCAEGPSLGDAGDAPVECGAEAFSGAPRPGVAAHASALPAADEWDALAGRRLLLVRLPGNQGIAQSVHVHAGPDASSPPSVLSTPRTAEELCLLLPDSLGIEEVADVRVTTPASDCRHPLPFARSPRHGSPRTHASILSRLPDSLGIEEVADVVVTTPRGDALAPPLMLSSPPTPTAAEVDAAVGAEGEDAGLKMPAALRAEMRVEQRISAAGEGCRQVALVEATGSRGRRRGRRAVCLLALLPDCLGIEGVAEVTVTTPGRSVLVACTPAAAPRVSGSSARPVAQLSRIEAGGWEQTVTDSPRI